MLSIDFIRKNAAKVRYSIDQKRLSDVIDLDEILNLEEFYRAQLRIVETKRSLRNQLSEGISQVEGKARRKLIREAAKVKKEIKELDQELAERKSKLDVRLLRIPNVIHPDVPEGIDGTENVVSHKVGKPKKFDFTPKDHMVLGESLDLIDTKTSAKVSGARFNYLKNEAVLMQFALINFVLDTLTDQAIIGELADKVGNPSATTFTPVIPPVMIKGEVAKRMARLDPVGERYYLPEDDLMFVGSAEHSLGPMFMDQTLDETQLPLRFVGYSTAFRREAGTYGKDTQGILRRHQFDKIEIESFTVAENGLVEQDLFVAIQEYLLTQLKIPYQVVKICTGDMGKPDYRQIDMECYMPGQGEYRETHTSDYMTDYQARRLNTRYKDSKGKTHFVHMNDATAFAIGRTLIAIFENYQQKDGSILIPEVLRSYMGGKEKIQRREGVKEQS